MVKNHVANDSRPSGGAEPSEQAEENKRLPEDRGSSLESAEAGDMAASHPRKNGRRKPWLEPKKPRKGVLLAMGYYVHEINVGVAKYARDAGWILTDITSRDGMIEP